MKAARIQHSAACLAVTTLTLSLLDITTTFGVRWLALPDGEFGQWWSGRWWHPLQVFLVLPWLAWVVRRFPAWKVAFLQIRLPHALKVSLLLFFGIEFAHIAFRYERYPFSDVGMFRDTASARSLEYVQADVLILASAQGAEKHVSWVRQGDLLAFDYFLGERREIWALNRFRKTNQGFAMIRQRFVDAGYPAPRLGSVSVRIRKNAPEINVIPKVSVSQ